VQEGRFFRCEINDPIFAFFDTAPSYVTNTTQPQQFQARQMVQWTLTDVDGAQKNKRNLDTMTLSDSDDERGDKEDRYEHDDEGSLYAEMPRRLHPNVPTTTTQATRQRRPLLLLLQSLGKRRSETSRLESPWG
jgi:hypothetical protein